MLNFGRVAFSYFLPFLLGLPFWVLMTSRFGVMILQTTPHEDPGILYHLISFCQFQAIQKHKKTTQNGWDGNHNVSRNSAHKLRYPTFIHEPGPPNKIRIFTSLIHFLTTFDHVAHGLHQFGFAEAKRNHTGPTCDMMRTLGNPRKALWWNFSQLLFP